MNIRLYMLPCIALSPFTTHAEVDPKAEARKEAAYKKQDHMLAHILNIFLQMLNIIAQQKNKDQVLASTAKMLESLVEVGKATRGRVTQEKLLMLVHEFAESAELDAQTTADLCEQISQAYYDLSTMSTNSLAN